MLLHTLLRTLVVGVYLIPSDRDDDGETRPIGQSPPVRLAGNDRSAAD